MNCRIKIKGKKIAVIGLGKSGVSSAKLLANQGGHVLISDSAIADERREAIESLKEYVLKIETGGHTRKILDSELIIVSPGVRLDIPILKEARDANIPIIGEVELAYQMIDPEYTKVIAITGSNGKTTTTALVGEIFIDAGAETFVCGNIGLPITELFLKPLKSFPKYLVVEISSFQLETMVNFKPWISVILNFSQDHLDRYRSMDEYIKTKMRIFENQDISSFLIVNANDRHMMEVSYSCKAKKVFFSRQRELESSSVWSLNDEIWANFGERLFICNRETIRLRGNHNLENAMAAIGVAMIGGIDPQSIKKTLSTFGGVSHRLEDVGGVGGIRFINDSKATNVDSVIRALESFDNPICLIAGGRDKGSDYSLLNPLLLKKVKALVLFGEAKDLIATMVDFTPIYKVTNMKEAVRKAYELARAGDICLLSPACSSFDAYRNFEERGEDFKREVAGLKEM